MEETTICVFPLHCVQTPFFVSIYLLKCLIYFAVEIFKMIFLFRYRHLQFCPHKIRWNIFDHHVTKGCEVHHQLCTAACGGRLGKALIYSFEEDPFSIKNSKNCKI